MVIMREYSLVFIIHKPLSKVRATERGDKVTYEVVIDNGFFDMFWPIL